jgi:hypothetical protein
MLDPFQTESASLDWRALRATRPRREKSMFASPRISLTRVERDQFFRLAYSGGSTPGAFMRQFARACADGAPIPETSLGPPTRYERPCALVDKVREAFSLRPETAKQALTRARSEGASFSGVLRRFIVAYVRDANARQPFG